MPGPRVITTVPPPVAPRRTALLLAGAAAVVAAWAPAGAQAPAHAETPAFEFRELAPGVVAAVVDPAVPSYAFANGLIVIGEDGVLVVDTQQSPRATLQVLREIRRRTPLPVRWVVNTHWHGDHVWGNAVYADSFPNAEFLASPATRDSVRGARDRQIREQRDHTRETMGQLREMRAGEADPDRRARIDAALEVRSRYLDDLAGLRRVAYDRLVADSLQLDLGGRAAVLITVGPAHTPGDLVVWLPGSGVAAVGDLIEEGELWTEGADPAAWVAALDRVEALGARVLLPGHGGVQTDLELLRRQRAELRAMTADQPPSMSGA